MVSKPCYYNIILYVWDASVTGLGPDYTIPGLWPELTLLALWFRQEPPFITVNSGVRPS